MTRDDGGIARKMLLESFPFGSLDRSLSRDDSSDLCCWKRYQRKWEGKKERYIRDKAGREELVSQIWSFLLELTRPVSSDYAVEKGSFYRVDDQITYPGNEMAISKDFELGI